MNEKQFPEQTGEIPGLNEPDVEIEISQDQPAEPQVLDLDTTMKLTVEELEEILANSEPKAAPVSDDTMLFASVAEAAPATEETMIFHPVEESASAPDETMIFHPVEEPASVPEETMIFPTVEEPAPLFHVPELREEITADEHAMAAHDLSHPSELEDYDLTDTAYDEGFRAADEDGLFDGMIRASAAKSVTIGESKSRPPRKGRPKRKKGYGLFGIPHLIATAIWLVIILAIGVSLGRMLWLCAADVLAFGREDKPVSITIAPEDTIEDIAEKLHEAQLIRYPGLFQLYASLAVDDGEIATGTFTLNTLYDYHAIVNGMSAYSSFREVVEDVLIPEGYNCRQIFELLEENGICTVAELEEYAANGEFQDFWFLEGIERGDKYCLEGYLFPDTYDFYAGSTPREAIGKMLLGFDARVDQEEVTAQLSILNQRLGEMMRGNGCSEAFIAENQIGMKELVIVASLIEEETSSASESKTIASVIYNRLTQDQVYERYLGIDATILYALGEHKDALTAEDLAIDSPYNTRTNAGLVPTPITNPGLDSLTAAMDPADTDYYYYVLNPATGSHQFSRTYEEHQAYVAQFGG